MDEIKMLQMNLRPIEVGRVPPDLSKDRRLWLSSVIGRSTVRHVTYT